MADRRVLFVHAHQDDESIETGATIARYAAEGAHVTLVTCTLGEEGETIPPELAHHAADRDDTLGRYRIGELAAACAALGVTDHRFLGGAGRWRDSGMMGAPSNLRPDCFWQADLDEAAAELVKVIREVRPQVLVTYDENGTYGHPDHIKAHRVSWRAYELAADPAFPGGEPWRIAKVYHTAQPRSVLRRGVEAMRGADMPFTRVASVGELPFGCDDAQVTTASAAGAHLPAKCAARRRQATQVMVHEPWFALSEGIGREVLGVEFFTLKAGAPGPRVAGVPAGEGGLGGPRLLETDLFAGIG